MSSILTKPNKPHHLLFLAEFLPRIYKTNYSVGIDLGNVKTKEDIEEIVGMKLTDNFINWLVEEKYLMKINDCYYYRWKLKQYFYMNPNEFEEKRFACD